MLKANKKYFLDFGFEIEPFGGREYSISSVPSSLLGMTEEELFLEMLDHLTADGSKDAFEIFASRLATMACKAAVKGNHSMSPQEADKLIDELLTLEMCIRDRAKDVFMKVMKILWIYIAQWKEK